MRTAVVGSGLSGLLCSAALARAGVSVVRVDKAAHDGGRARAAPMGHAAAVASAAVAMNLGPRALYRGGPLDRALRSFGIEPAGFVPPTKGALALLGDARGGELVALPSSVGDLLGARFLDGRDKRALAKALARITIGALDVDAGMSVGAWLDVHGGTARARALLAALVRVATYAHDEKQDATLALHQMRRALARGVLYVDGTWDALVAPLVAHLDDAGVRVVRRDVRAPADLEGLADDLDVERVVLALPAPAAHALVAGLPEAPPPVIASCLDVALRALPRPQHRFCLGVDRPLYLSVHSPRPAASSASSPASAPSSTDPRCDVVRVHVMAYGGGERAELEALLDAVQPGWRGALVDEHAVRYLPRMVVQSSLARAGSARTPLTLDGRVFFAGDHVDVSTLLADASAESALRVADAIASRVVAGAAA